MASRRKRKNDSWFSFLDAHRLKATLASLAATIGLLVSMGVVDVGKLPPWAVQLLPQLGLAPTTGAPTAAAPPVSSTGAGAISTCFTPGQDCTGTIVLAIDQAKTEILVQAYGFTSKPIAEALVRAKTRGVTIMVVLDRSNETSNDSAADYLVTHGIQPRIDSSVTIAHNKVMIIDQSTVLTGSFNFTESAQKRNAENVLIISGDKALAAQYRRNFEQRLTASRRYLGYIAPYM
jgi:phosphatidylserine/phosphatidylglycerophosphate/cardiolipin synthase-like enzyme